MFFIFRLGLNHDDDYGCMSGLNIMSSWRPAGRDSFTWSECSRQNIRTFLGYVLYIYIELCPLSSKDFYHNDSILYCKNIMLLSIV